MISENFGIVLALLLCNLTSFSSALTSGPATESPQGHCTCCQGQAGPSGQPGIPGLPGSNGVQGPAGPKGDPGLGLPGLKGDRGDKGPTGGQGTPGRQGLPGKLGLPGAKGDRGDRGEKGSKGNPGFPGRGPAGPQGNVGEPGKKGDRGTAGSKGQPGNRGPTGPRGEKGQKGHPGEASFLTPTTSPIVAFDASLSSLFNGNIGDVIVFDDVVTNLGGGYDLQTGVFNCSVSGVYFFSVSILSLLSSNRPWARLKKNGQILLSVHDSHPNYHHQSSASVVVVLATGDRVWLESKTSGRSIDGNYNRFSRFSGFLIRKL